MPIVRFLVCTILIALAPGALIAQTVSPPAANADAGQASLTSLLQPSLDTLQKRVEGLRLDKWKGGSVRAEAERNISSIKSDLENALPTLLKAGDSNPGLVSGLLPIGRNVDALYDVVLRVYDGARVAGPGDQAGQLQQAMSELEAARRALNERMQAAAAAQEKQMGDLRVELTRQATPICPAQPAAPNCPATPAKKVVKRKPKPAAKPAPAAPAATPAPGAAPKPNG